jgi:hypothetical protein
MIGAINRHEAIPQVNRLGNKLFLTAIPSGRLRGVLLPGWENFFIKLLTSGEDK